MNNEQVVQQEVVQPQPVAQTVAPAPKKKGKGGLVVVILLVLLLIGGGVFAYFKFFGVTPYSVYQKLIKDAITDTFKYAHDDKVYEYDTTLDFDLDVPSSVLPSDVQDLFNKIFIKVDAQLDKTNHKMALKLDSTYDKDAFLKGSMYAEFSNNKAYLYVPDYYDKYLETSAADFKDVVETLDREYDYKTIEKVLLREVPKLIKEEDCSKEDSFYVFKVKNSEFAKRVESLITTLKRDSEFVKAMGGKEAVDELFSNTTFESGSEDSELVVKINDKEYIVTGGTETISGELKGDTTTFKMVSDGKETGHGSITVKGNADDQTINLEIVTPETGSVKVNITLKYKKISSVEAVDQNNVKKMESLTQQELYGILEKFSKSKAYTVIEKLSQSSGFSY